MELSTSTSSRTSRSSVGSSERLLRPKPLLFPSEMGDLKASDTLRDAVYIYVTATGLAATGLSPTCNVRKLTDDTTQAGTVAEVGSGIYKMSRAVAAEAFYLAEWAVTGAYTIVGNYKLFKACGGRVEDIHGYVDDLETRLTAARAGYLDELDFDLNARLGSPAGASLAADLLVLDNLGDTLEGGRTAARAGYLDNINQAGLLQVTAARAGYLDRLQGHLVTRIFWSDVDDVIDLPTDSSDVALPSVVLPDIAGTIVSVKAGIKIRMIENTNAGGTNGP